MKAEERIYVRTRDFEGMATVLHIVKNEIYPVQVEMDKPDSDGHKIFRVAYHEIVKESGAFTPSQSIPVVESKSPELQRQMSFLDML